MRAFKRNPPCGTAGKATWRRGIAQRTRQGCYDRGALSNTDFPAFKTFEV
jgi:hypothetical protein